MDVIRIFNGLGNQMSQYAFYYAKKKAHPFRTCFITNRYDSENIHNGYELDRVFGIKRDLLKEKILYRFLRSHSEAFTGYRLLWHFTHIIEEKSNYDYDVELLKPALNMGFTFYWGGWHSEKYFAHLRDEILDIFRFDENKLNDESRRWIDMIRRDSNSCSLHIRRGDFLKDKKWADAITPDYYNKAINFIRGKFPGTIFYVFSNDIEWSKEKFGLAGFKYVECNKGEDSWQDMFLMTCCHNHINANSSFSWWGAWLCKYKDAIVIVPRDFISTVKTLDVYPDKWIKL